jgi:hypothetical protein
MPSQRKLLYRSLKVTADDAELALSALAGGSDEVFEVHRADSLLPGLDRLAHGDIEREIDAADVVDVLGCDGLVGGGDLGGVGAAAAALGTSG